MRDLIDKFVQYQIDWLTSHCDIELDQKTEDLIIGFLRDTAHCYQEESV